MEHSKVQADGIKIQGEEWFMTAGLIGVKRLFLEDVETTAGGLIIHESLLEQLPDKYFAYLLEEYSIAKRDSKRIARCLNRSKSKPESARERFDEITKIAAEQFKKVDKYFSGSEECLELKTVIGKMKEIKKAEQLEDMEGLANEYCHLMETPDIEKKLTLNYVKAMIISPYYGQTSFLNVAFQGDLEAHIEKMRKDFAEPACREISYYKLVREKEWEPVKGFLEENKSCEPYKMLYKASEKMNSFKEYEEWIYNNVVPCSLIEELPASMSFEEMMFAPLGLSAANSYNFFWDFNKKNPIPMCALARLILFLIPIGVSIYQRKFITNGGTEYKQFAGLVLKETDFNENLKINQYYNNKRGGDSSISEIIMGLLNDVRETVRRKKDSYLFIEFHSDYKMKKTLLDYYHMPEYLSSYFNGNDRLKYMTYIECQDDFIRTVLHGIDPKQEVFRYVREAVRNNYYAFGAYMATRERNRILMLKKQKEEDEMEKQDKRIEAIYIKGKELKVKLLSSNQNNDENGPYRASASKKIEAIAYRLLNAVKAGDEEGFLDNVYRLHISAGQPVSSIFLDVVKDEGLDLGSIGSAFIAGLLVDTEYNKKEEQK